MGQLSNALELTPEAIKTINQILASRKHAEVAILKDKLVVWELGSKTKYEVAIKG